MKLCQKCRNGLDRAMDDEILKDLDTNIDKIDPNWIYGIVPVPEADCDFWAHRELYILRGWLERGGPTQPKKNDVCV
jgi:hypothetical protein